MLLIVNDSLDASSQTATIPEKLSRARTWTRLLFGLIPADGLQLAFDLAFTQHKGPFPVNAYEIKDAWENFNTVPDPPDPRTTPFDEMEFKRMLETQQHQGDQTNG